MNHRKPNSPDFRSRFRRQWFARWLVLYIYGILSMILGAIFAINAIYKLIIPLISPDIPTQELVPAWILLAATYFFVECGYILMHMPQMLAKTALKLIYQCDMAFYLFHNIVDLETGEPLRTTFTLAPTPEATLREGKPFDETIWTLSRLSRKSVDANYAVWKRSGEIGLYSGDKWIDDPTVVIDSRFGIRVRQAPFYLLIILCTCVMSGLFLITTVIGMVIPIVVCIWLMRRVNQLAFAAAYYRILTDEWPWERKIN